MKAWEPFSKHLLEQIVSRHQKIVFILLGANAQKRMEGLDLSNHRVLKFPHPSPLSAYRGFFGSKVFSKTNQALDEMGRDTINWQLP